MAEFDKASVEHGQLIARVDELERRLEMLDARQQAESVAMTMLRGAQKGVWVFVTLMAGLLTLVIAGLGLIRHWWSNL